MNNIIKKSIYKVLKENADLKRQQIEDAWNEFELDKFYKFGEHRNKLNRLDNLNKYDIRGIKPHYPYQNDYDLEDYYGFTVSEPEPEALDEIVSESINHLILERQNLKSQKLHNIIKQHKGIKTNRGIFDLHNMTDDDIIDVVEYKDIQKYNDFKTNIVDEIEYIPLNDGYYIIALCRGCNFDRVRMPDRKRFPGDFEDLHNKKVNRERNRKQVSFWTNRDAEDLFKNPYFRNGEGNWTKERKSEVMNNLRNKQKHSR